MNNTTDFFNDTHLPDDPFDEEDLSEPFDFETFIKYTFLTAKIFSDIVIIYSISKFKVLRTWENTLIMHWAIMDVLYITFHLVFVNWLRSIIHIPGRCFMTTIISSLFMSNIIFAEAIIVGFLILNSKCSIVKNYENSFKKFYLLSVYIVCGLESLVDYLTCEHWFDILMFVTHTILIASFFINIYLKKCIKYDGHVTQTYYVVYISNIGVFSLVPVFIYHYLLRCFRFHEGFVRFLESTMFISSTLLFSNSIFILYILYKYCREFRTVLVLVFKKVVMRTGVSWTELQQDV